MNHVDKIFDDSKIIDFIIKYIEAGIGGAPIGVDIPVAIRKIEPNIRSAFCEVYEDKFTPEELEKIANLGPGILQKLNEANYAVNEKFSEDVGNIVLEDMFNQMDQEDGNLQN